MTHPKLVVVASTTKTPEEGPDTRVMSLPELAARARRGAILRELFRYSETRLLVEDLAVISRPFEIGLVLRLLCRGACWFEDDGGARMRISLPALGRLLARAVSVRSREPFAVRRIRRQVETARKSLARPAADRAITRSGPRSKMPGGCAVYLYADLVPALVAGGSVGHIGGVINTLPALVPRVRLLTSTAIPLVREDVPVDRIPPEGSTQSYEHRALQYHEQFVREAATLLDGEDVAFIYQRYSVFNFSGATLATRLGVPLVLEFNGSEVWAQRHWGNRLRLEAIAESIETLNLEAADLVVVVSRPIRDELVRHGHDESRILVNPNGVDPERYHPDVDGGDVRRRYDLEGRTVIGFIGTFGRWHGAEVLVEAFGRLLAAEPARRASLRLLMIGDGVTMAEVRERIATHGIEACCVLAGRVPQAQGAAHLAACDVLASPHTPNPDGTPFFGSPTKLFEYMAMGRGIVASDLEQIGEVLEHNRTACLVPPGDADALADGLRRLVDAPDLRTRLGRAARETVVERYTWKANTQRMFDALRERVRWT